MASVTAVPAVRPPSAPWAVLAEAVRRVAEDVMNAEVDRLCGPDGHASHGRQRVNRRNGFRKRRWMSRYGPITLAIPKLRHGNYLPAWLCDGAVEHALVTFIGACWSGRVRAEQIEALLDQLGVRGISAAAMTRMAEHLQEDLAALARDVPAWAGATPAGTGSPPSPVALTTSEGTPARQLVATRSAH